MAGMIFAREHWDNTYATKSDTGVSWYQADPSISFKWIRSIASDRSAPIVDVGGGASRMVDWLVADGYVDVTVLDISEAALARSRVRLGAASGGVNWIVADITQWEPPKCYAVWHDRAVFHFLVDASARNAYLQALRRGTNSGSLVIIATFALSGPERCSGLPVQRYSPATLAARLGQDFEICDQAAETHRTPFGTTQEFIYAVFRRR